MSAFTKNEMADVHILLVEDEEHHYHLIKRQLYGLKGGANYHLKWVLDVESALDTLAEDPVDVCLMDYYLGSQTGLQLAKMIRSRHMEVPIIFITGVTDYQSDVEAMKSGATDYLIKGEFDASKLERSIRYAIERKQAADRAQYNNRYYSWVGLPNRLLLVNRLKRVIEKAAKKRNGHFGVLMIGVDKFGRINDTYGYSVGDRLLAQISERLKSCIRGEDMLGHLGGDQFLILSTDLEDFKTVLLISNRLQSAFNKPFKISRDKIFLSIRVGIVIAGKEYQSAEVVLRDAGRACEDVEEDSNIRHTIYRHDLGARATRLFQLETELRKAIEQKEFKVYYQPIVSISTGKMVGFEALIRWEHPDKGFLSPADFIPLAEETGLIIPMGEWVLREALLQTKTWEKSGYGEMRLAVNFSARQFHQLSLTEIIQKVLKETGVQPGKLELEITETAAMKDLNVSVNNLKELSTMGVHISIDDFGTGYSSLASLKTFPVKTLKIDRSFTSEISTENQGIIRAIIAMAKYLNLRIVAEGVETAGQLAFLKKEGCHEFQGFLYSRPLSAEELTKWLEQGHVVEG